MDVASTWLWSQSAKTRGQLQMDPQSSKPTLETKADVKSLLERSDAKYSIRLETHKRGLELAVHITPKGKGDILKDADLRKLFEEIGLNATVDEEAVKQLCAKANLGEKLENVVLARGVDPIDGKDERLEFVKLPSSDKPRYVKDELGNIDYTQTRLFDNVVPGDLIAYIREPDDGTAGKSVVGEPVPASKGLWMQERPKCGDGVKLEADGKERRFMAYRPGRIVFEQNSIYITNEFTVRGDVDYSIGHVDFVGDVTIVGDVQPSFNVKAGGNLKIKGNSSQCRIEAGGDIDMGGMSGGENGQLICGGNLHARYLNDTHIECKKDIKVKNEIVNCTVKCGGMIDVNMGAIVGGSCMALTGIEAKGFGSEGKVKTRLTCGVCYMALEKIHALRDELTPIRKETEELSKKLEPFVKNPKAMLAISQKEREHVKECAKRLNAVVPIQNELQKKLKEAEEDMDSRANPIINARSYCLPGVFITIGPNTEETPELTRPTTIIRNSRKGRLRYLPLHQITEKYRDIERELIREEDEEERLERERKEAERKKAAEGE